MINIGMEIEFALLFLYATHELTAAHNQNTYTHDGVNSEE